MHGHGLTAHAVDGKVGHRLVNDEPRTVAVGEGRNPSTLLIGHDAARRVVHVGHEVGEARRRAGKELGEGIVIPPGIGTHGHPDQSRAGRGQRFEGVRVARVLHEGTVAAADECGRDEGDGVLRAEGNQHLLGRRRKPAGGVAVGERRAQLVEAEQVEAGEAEVVRQPLYRGGCRVDDGGQGGQRRL